MRRINSRHLRLVHDARNASDAASFNRNLIGNDPRHLDHDQYPRIRRLNLCLCGDTKTRGVLRCPECALVSDIDHGMMRDWERSLGGSVGIKMAKRVITVG